MDRRAGELEEELLQRFGRGIGAPLSEAEFDRLALAVFAHQFRHNGSYAAYCRARRATPERVAGWREIPALPTAAFKVAELTTLPPEEIRVVYHTSGTTAGRERPGRHFLPDTRLYDASLEPNFRAHLLPDLEQIRVLVLAPTSQHFPHSSLGHMNSRVLERFGAAGSGVFWTADGPRFPELAAALRQAEADGEPVCLVGTAFGFVHLLDWLASEGRRHELPVGSRIMDTGGYKGRSREVPKAELYERYSSDLGVPAAHIVNEYGMTEMGSQFYDDVLRSGGQDSRAPRKKVPPPWVRTQVVDPESLEPLPNGRVGLLRHFDLANLHTACHIQTDDLGVWQEDGAGFEILGRAAGTEPRGCSLTAEEP